MEKFRYVRAGDGVTLWTASSGPAGGVPLVLCHGGPGLWDMLGGLAAMVDDLVSVTRYDQRGGPRSPAPGPWTVDGWIRDLDAIRADLGADRWLVGGHSWGASLALLWALRHPGATLGVVAVAPPGLGPPEGDDFRREHDRRLGAEGRARLAELAALIEDGTATAAEAEAHRRLLWSTDLGDPARSAAALEELVGAGFQVNRGASRLGTEDWRRVARSIDGAALAALRVPVLLVAGDADPRPLQPVRELAARLPAAELHVLGRVGHFPWLEAPGAVRGLLREFVARVLAKASR